VILLVERARTILKWETWRDFASLIDVTLRSRFVTLSAIAWLAACGGTPREPTRIVEAPRPPSPDAPLAPDPDLHREPVKPLLAIDWATVPLATEADATAVWKLVAPTGADVDAKLDEIPAAATRPLAIAMLHAGNFTCAQPPPQADCAAVAMDVPDPAPTAGLDDPCLRRVLALWSVAALEDDDVPKVIDALRAIVAIPPPESQLVAAALHAIPEDDHAGRLDLLAIAYQAGQRELANGNVGSLDEAHLIEAVKKHHIDAALDVLSAEAHRAVYLAAITDEALAAPARVSAITELAAAQDALAPDTRAAIVTATKAKDCSVAAAAARVLVLRGDARFAPVRPRTGSVAAMMRSLCVLASYERLQPNDEASLLATFIPAKGLEQVRVAYDALGEVDTDGDGDPHTTRTVDLIKRDEAVVPEIDDLIRAFRHCTGTTCTSPDRVFKLGLGPVAGQLWLTRLELDERPPCPSR
jgi:hypothetical protein